MIILRHCRVIDGTGQDPVENVDIALEDGRIRRMAVSPVRMDRDAMSVDLEGLTVMPGLMDLHTHLGLVALDGLSELEPAMLAAKIFENAALCVASGHTTAREVAGADGGLRSVIESGLVLGPRLFPSGPLLCQTGGHGHTGPRFLPTCPDGLPGLSQMSAVCDGADAVRLAAREAFRRGATQIKVAMTGPILSADMPLEWTQFTSSELQAAVDEAHAHGSYVTGHAHTCSAIRHGLSAGLECFEHGTFLDEETAAAMATAGAALVPTLTILHVTAEEWRQQSRPASDVERVDRAKEAMVNSIRLAHDAGVKVGSGTDLFGASQNRRGCEVMLKSTVLGAMEAIVSATQTSAQILRVADELGTLAEGKCADIIALDGDPLAEPAIFEDPDRVVLVLKGGQVMKERR